MSMLRTPDDVEQQAAQESPNISDHRELSTITPFGLKLDLPRRHYSSLSDRTAHCCYLCLQGKDYEQYAVPIPCFRPSKPRRVLSELVSISGNAQSKTVRYDKLNPKENACESDASIYDRLREACFQQQSKWKRWIPFYGVVNVREVKFRFLGAPDRVGRFPIHICPLNIGEIWKEANKTIALEPNDPDFDDFCDGSWHSRECEISMEMRALPCIKEQILEARQRRKNLDVLYLPRNCVRNPLNANGLRTLEGMAQESCILDTSQIVIPSCQQPYDSTDELPGIQLILGWEWHRITYEVPIKIAWIFLSLAVIWLCVIVFGGLGGDWATAMAFGQLLAASISLPFLYARNQGFSR